MAAFSFTWRPCLRALDLLFARSSFFGNPAVATCLDAAVYADLGTFDTNEFPHLTRWFSHIQSLHLKKGQVAFLDHFVTPFELRAAASGFCTCLTQIARNDMNQNEQEKQEEEEKQQDQETEEAAAHDPNESKPEEEEKEKKKEKCEATHADGGVTEMLHKWMVGNPTRERSRDHLPGLYVTEDIAAGEMIALEIPMQSDLFEAGSPHCVMGELVLRTTVKMCHEQLTEEGYTLVQDVMDGLTRRMLPHALFLEISKEAREIKQKESKEKTKDKKTSKKERRKLKHVLDVRRQTPTLLQRAGALLSGWMEKHKYHVFEEYDARKKDEARTYDLPVESEEDEEEEESKEKKEKKEGKERKIPRALVDVHFQAAAATVGMPMKECVRMYNFLSVVAKPFLTSCSHTALGLLFFRQFCAARHHCDPSASYWYTQHGHVIVVANRALKCGEEITVSYDPGLGFFKNATRAERYDVRQCRCPRCHGVSDLPGFVIEYLDPLFGGVFGAGAEEAFFKIELLADSAARELNFDPETRWEKVWSIVRQWAYHPSSGLQQFWKKEEGKEDKEEDEIKDGRNAEVRQYWECVRNSPMAYYFSALLTCLFPYRLYGRRHERNRAFDEQLAKHGKVQESSQSQTSRAEREGHARETLFALAYLVRWYSGAWTINLPVSHIVSFPWLPNPSLQTQRAIVISLASCVIDSLLFPPHICQVSRYWAAFLCSGTFIRQLHQWVLRFNNHIVPSDFLILLDGETRFAVMETEDEGTEEKGSEESATMKEKKEKETVFRQGGRTVSEVLTNRLPLSRRHLFALAYKHDLRKNWLAWLDFLQEKSAQAERVRKRDKEEEREERQEESEKAKEMEGKKTSKRLGDLQRSLFYGTDELSISEALAMTNAALACHPPPEQEEAGPEGKEEKGRKQEEIIPTLIPQQFLLPRTGRLKMVAIYAQFDAEALKAGFTTVRSEDGIRLHGMFGASEAECRKRPNVVNAIKEGWLHASFDFDRTYVPGETLESGKGGAEEKDMTETQAKVWFARSYNDMITMAFGNQEKSEVIVA